MAARLKVYVASKLKEGPMWRELAVKWSEIEIISRWPFLHVAVDGSPAWPSDCAAHGSVFWQHDHENVARADVILVYAASSDDVLRGALVEAGMAIALGKTVIVVGHNPGYGTWQYHPAVKRVDTLETARSLLWLLASGYTGRVGGGLMLHELPNGSHIELTKVDTILVHEPFPPFSTSSVAILLSTQTATTVPFDTHSAALDYARTLAGLVNDAKGKPPPSSYPTSEELQQAHQAKLVARGDDTC